MIPRVAVLIIAHAPLATALVECAQHVYACAPESLTSLAAIDILPNADVAKEVAAARVQISGLERGRGVLVLTDLFGASPANIAAQLAAPGSVDVVTGVNLPMLLRSLCYCDQMTLADLSEKALIGGASGVMKLAATPPQNQRTSRDATASTEKLDHAHTRLHDQQ